jgi:hypothetical protein
MRGNSPVSRFGMAKSVIHTLNGRRLPSFGHAVVFLKNASWALAALNEDR